MNTALPRHIAYLGIGSNRGDRRANLQAACRLLRAADGVEELVGSPVYETCAIGLAGPAEFLNAVVRVTTQLAPTALLRTVRAIERALGRGIDRAGPRTIDLDILLYDDLVLKGHSCWYRSPISPLRRLIRSWAVRSGNCLNGCRIPAQSSGDRPTSPDRFGSTTLNRHRRFDFPLPMRFL